jgi:DNA-binding NarL/FixJ family response regulator
VSQSALLRRPAAARARIVIAEVDPLARGLIASALSKAGIDVVAAVSSADEAVELAISERPDVLVSGLTTAEGEGLAAIERLRSAGRGDVAVLVFTSSEEPEVALAALEAGASGYLNRGAGVESLERAVLALADGEAVIPRRLGNCILERLRQPRADHVGMRPVRSPLTPREWEVFDLMCAGCSTAVIAETFVVSPETVRSHVKRILRKLGVRTRKDAVEKAGALRVAEGPRRPVPVPVVRRVQ